VLWLLFDGFVLTCPIGGASTPPFISRGGGGQGYKEGY
jgi:hypothetical protein